MKLSRLKTLKQTAHSVSFETDSGTRDVPIVVKKHARSRHMVIRYQPLEHQLLLTIPRYVTISQGLDFVEQKRLWIERQLRAHAKRIPLVNGQRVELLGESYMLRHVGGRGVVRIEGDEILVPGDAGFMQRRVREWLKHYARKVIHAMATAKATLAGVRFRRITVRDTRSRWGSCSHDGNLSFSWRLIFAPRQVLEYVVCHEVAHLRHMDHSPSFWQVVATLQPDFALHRHWLRQHSALLYAYD